MSGEQQAICGFVDQVVDACSDVVRQQDAAAAPPKRLYHFTDAAGFDGIIASRSLWSSLATALNDAEEVRHGIEIAKSIAADRVAASSSPYYRALIECLENPRATHFKMSFDVSVLIVSFCGRCDKASQWLHYGRTGTGVAIGFGQRIAQVVGRDLAPVDYDPSSQAAWLEKLVLAGDTVASSRPSAPWMIEAAAHLVSNYVPASAARMKHHSFADEEEWRLVGLEVQLNGRSITPSTGGGALKWRRAGEALIPYEELSFQADTDVVEEAVVGYFVETRARCGPSSPLRARNERDCAAIGCPRTIDRPTYIWSSGRSLRDVALLNC